MNDRPPHSDYLDGRPGMFPSWGEALRVLVVLAILSVGFTVAFFGALAMFLWFLS